jgi:murein DD-endopeptidase MepM/ murein hydrolase activator NlpD
MGKLADKADKIPAGIAKPDFRLFVLSITFTLIIVGCQPGSAVVSRTEIDDSPASATDPTVPPPIISTAIGGKGPQSFSPLSNAELSATATVENNLEQRDQVEVDLIDSAADLESDSSPAASPQPTFTAPALPDAQPWDHYWLRRPIPEGGTVWTDKAYPYGSNRGGTLRTHHGVEFNVPKGTQVLATASGTVIAAGNDKETELGATPDFYGNVVVIEHDNGLDGLPVYSLYGHLSEVYVAVGQRIVAQDPIGSSGASGVADGPHLHFEVRVGENSYEATRNPLLWLYPFPERGVVAGLIKNNEGQIVRNAAINLRRIDAESAYAATTSYADDSVIPDDKWQENFVFDDVVAGYYELTVGQGADKIKHEFWVYPYQTNFVEVIYDD